MKKTIFIILILLFSAALRPAYAFMAEESNQIKLNEEPREDARELILRSFLEKTNLLLQVMLIK